MSKREEITFSPGLTTNLQQDILCHVLQEIEAMIMSCLEEDPINIDEIVSQTSRSPGEINAALTLLQLKGLVRQLPGSYYQKRV